jgi:hypothetical protein
VPAGSPGAISSPYIPGVSFGPSNVCPSGVPVTAQSPFGQTVPVQPYGCTGNLGRNTFVRPLYFDLDLRFDRKFYLGETMNIEFIADAFNLLNRFNVLDVNLLCNPVGATCTAGQPSAAFDPRQFQFGLKFNF